MSTTTTTTPTNVLIYAPRGAARAIFTDHAPEVVLSGPAGTGKSRAMLEKLHLCAAKYPGARILVVRKTYASLKASGLVTMDEKIQPQLDGVVFRGDTAKRPAHYAYPNGAVIVVGGMDRATKVMSAEYDLVYVQEATELDEHDWEALSTRLRNGRMPYQQMLADCNPDSPTHWLKLRADAGRVVMLESRHEDNPLLWDDVAGSWTPEGVRYMAVLDALTGVRLLRLRYGVWAAAEGMVYEGAWDRARNVVDRFTVPPQWTRYLVVDFGFVHPFCAQWWAEDDDGRLYLYREIYQTHRLVEDHARRIKELSRWGQRDGEPLPHAIICDHDAEDRATLERHLGLHTIPAHKGVSDGIQAVASRMKPAGDGKVRLALMRDALVERDSWLVDRKQPTCTADEVESYVWDTGAGRKRGEQPVKEHDHGMDALRYMVASKDLGLTDVTIGPKLY